MPRMLFGSPVFLFVFLPLVLAATTLAPRRLKNAVLLVASLLFYAWGEQGYVLVMLASIAGNFVFGRMGRGGLVAAVLFNVGLLAWFKYADFALPGSQDVHLPIGISFFTFQALSYVIDVRRGDAERQESAVDFGLFVALFPQLIAGPILRYRQLAPQLQSRRVTWDLFSEGVGRFIVGLGKKLLVADVVAVTVDRVFSLPEAHLTPAVAWTGVAAFAVQVYFDFSGYSDMAIGLGRMFGFRIPENFEYPYISRSIAEFWRRWHISLTTWFRDYVYKPIGGGRGTPARVAFNIVVVFLLVGLWHGAAWTFVAWGAYHGVFLVIERFGLGRRVERWPSALCHVYVLGVFLVSMAIFRAVDLGHAGAMIGAMFGLGAGSGVEAPLALLVDPLILTAMIAGAVGSTPVLTRLPALAPLRTALLLGVLVACGLQVAGGTYLPFVYFRF